MRLPLPHRTSARRQYTRTAPCLMPYSTGGGCPGRPRLRAAILVGAVVLLLGSVSAGARAAPSGTNTPPPAVGAVLELTDVTHALQERTLVISGWVRNASRLPVAGLVIDASGFAPVGDLAAFGSDGIPWSVPPGSAEH